MSRHGEAFVRSGEARIYLLTDTFSFAVARRAHHPCGAMHELRKIASVVIHEAWHVRHPGDEAGAYWAQLDILSKLGAGPGTRLYMEVWRASRAQETAAPRTVGKEARAVR